MNCRLPNCYYPINCKRKQECLALGSEKVNCKYCGSFPCKCEFRMSLGEISDESTGRKQAEYDEIPEQANSINYGGEKSRPRNGSPTFYALLETMAAIHDSKSHDYANNANPYGNYHFAGQLSKLFNNSDDAGFIARIAEKIYRLANLENVGKTAKNETVEDTENDICVIIALWMASRKDRRGKNQTYQKSMYGGAAGVGKTETLHNKTKATVESIDQINRINDALNRNQADNPVEITDYRFHTELVHLLNKHGIDSAMNVADHTIALKIIGDLLVWRNQVG